MKRIIGLLAVLGASLVLAGCGITAKDIPYATLEAKYGGPASHYMDLPGDLRVHYRDQGRADGPTVVLVHGFAASLHTWEPWVARLAPDYRVISLDLPGHGLTRAPEGYVAAQATNVAVVDELTRNLKAERFSIVGNSMGGGVAWAYGLAHPDRLTGLVLVDAAGWPRADKGKEKPPVVFKLLGNPAGRAFLRNINPRPLAAKGLRSAYVDEKLVTPALVDRYVELALAPGHRAILTSGRDGPQRRVDKAAFGAIKTPTLVMHGEADTVIDVAAGRGLASAIPGAKLITYPGVGHVPMEQIPDPSAKDLRTFLATLPPN
ncbi:alpha/beta fold hydrolase [Phenylobacterium sp.]|uniref:alpha/beta fold hydrolase n=1 Tax=Phenylobacterium sp. TaxID=1871053 RepID=UPI002720216D|nr:alpha/beta hydrolase [Phenylobacterium sp.]MDO8377444.1 alpha/beta hydrolase [Phenylobacterium sp.]